PLFFTAPPPPKIYTLSLHDALPISNPPSLQLYVKLCAACPYLAGILTSYPGMIDELMDSLIVQKLSSLEVRVRLLGELLRGAERSEEHTSELQSRENLVCRLLLEKK